MAKELDIEVLAETSSFSLFYYERLFSRLVKKTVREFIKLGRLDRVLEELRHKQNRILDVALEYGFGSPLKKPPVLISLAKPEDVSPRERSDCPQARWAGGMRRLLGDARKGAYILCRSRD